MEGGVFKWITFQEILFLFISCSVLAFLLRSQDSLEFKLVLNVTTEERAARENYANQKFPLRNEKLPLPIVTDLESDGQTDVILVSADKVLNVYSRHYTPSYLGHHGIKHSNKNVSLSKTSRVVAMTTGFLQPYQSVVQVRKQVIAVLYSDWTLSCYNHNLKLMWSQKLNEKEIPISSEASLLVSAISIKKSPAGVILVGGRINGNYDNNNNNDNIGGDSDKRRMRRGAEQEKMEHQKLESLGHYCTYAVSGKTGELLWKHEPGDFEVHPAYDIGLSSFTHFKLLFHKYLLHEGEVSWHQYSSAIRQIMPHSWTDDFDTKLELAQFNKDKKKSDEPGVTDHKGVSLTYRL
ncbi:PREDICTED: uncharacterized protein LOC109581595 [Amphimedon queenslandica]|uniref:Uncharacterized protein n=1 Tax=Amphimedon queenslandica TaxID=400682 RepID=A0AAN0J329_AMPQE|nr:PREDICTED: uncharacterized protein LOC109581595 [Amphimedon queenslandica]|eukprot:XP_019851410.1 PREDICTED: uncharacterized protein LOC109581595 [Amphimedon queenslandica]